MITAAIGVYPLRDVRQQRGQGLQGPRRLPDGPHLQPVAEQHDRHQQGQLPPEVEVEEAEGHRGARHERDRDRHAYEQHHPRLPVPRLPKPAHQERPAAPHEDERAQYGCDPPRAGNPGIEKPSHIWTISLDNTTGTDNTSDIQNRSLNIATECPAFSSRPDVSDLAGLLAVVAPEFGLPLLLLGLRLLALEFDWAARLPQRVRGRLRNLLPRSRRGLLLTVVVATAVVVLHAWAVLP